MELDAEPWIDGASRWEARRSPSRVGRDGWENIQGKALVVGGGFIGSHVAADLLRSGISTTVLTRTPPNRQRAEWMINANVVVASAGDAAAVEFALRGVTQVIYCAGGLLPMEAEGNPIAHVAASLSPLLTVLEELRRLPGAGIVFVSSGGTVYGSPQTLPVSESCPTAPSGSYGTTTVAAEQYVRLYQMSHGVPSLTLRCGNVYGEGQPGDRSQGLVAAALDCAATRRPLHVFGDGSALRDYIHVSDVVAVMRELSGREDLPAVLNVGSGRGTTVKQVVETVSRVTSLPIRVEHSSRRQGDITHIVLDIDRLQSLMPFEPHSLHAGVTRTWALRDQYVEGPF